MLEIGCGSGGTLRMLRSEQPIIRAVGFELDPDAAEHARSVFDTVYVGNAETMPLPDERFDLILALDVLEHLVDPWRMARRLRALLSPGGTIIASIPNVGHYSVIWPLFRGHWQYTDLGLLDRTHLRFFTEESARALLSVDGLRVQRMLTNDALPMVFRFQSQRFRWYQRQVIGALMPKRLSVMQFLIASSAP